MIGRIRDRFRGAIAFLRYRGPLYIVYVVTGVAVPALAIRISTRLTRWSHKAKLGAAAMVSAVLGFTLGWALVDWRAGIVGAIGGPASMALPLMMTLGSRRRRASRLIADCVSFDSAEKRDVAFRRDTTLAAAREVGPDGAECNGADAPVLGWIDPDGRLRGDHPPPPGLESIAAADGVDCGRFLVEISSRGSRLVVCKNFCGDRDAFLREGSALALLAETGATPQLVAADARRLVIERAFVPGQTLRDALHSAGAKILNAETDANPELRSVDGPARARAIWKRGREHLERSVPEGFVCALEDRLDRIHRAGVTGFSLTFGNVVIHQETGEPWIIDFDAARVHRSTKTLAFRRDRDRDRELFNEIYGTEVMTEARAREALRKLPSGYAPVDLGGGLVTRGFWSVDSGTGRWEYLNAHAVGALVAGKRILDLGSNNGVMPLMMLRSGARSVLGIEQSPELVEASIALHRVFEWRDMRRYDFGIRCADMREILHDNWGGFDVVTSFASLYYLDEADMARVAAKARELAPAFVVQAKSDTRLESPDDKAKKSSVEFLHALLADAGYPDVSCYSKRGFGRPILVAK